MGEPTRSNRPGQTPVPAHRHVRTSGSAKYGTSTWRAYGHRPRAPRRVARACDRRTGSTRRAVLRSACPVEGWSGAAKSDHSYRTRIARTTRTAILPWHFRRSARRDVGCALSLVNRGLRVRARPPAGNPLCRNVIRSSSTRRVYQSEDQIATRGDRRHDLRKRRTPRVGSARHACPLLSGQPWRYRTRIARFRLELWPVAHPVIEEGSTRQAGPERRTLQAASRRLLRPSGRSRLTLAH